MSQRLDEALLGRRLERVLHHLGARVAVLLPRRRVRAARGSLAPRLRPQRPQRAARQRQRQQRRAHRDQHRRRRVARARPRRHHLLRAVVSAPAVHAVAHVVSVRGAALLARAAVQAGARAVALAQREARVLQRALVAAESRRTQTCVGAVQVEAVPGPAAHEPGRALVHVHLAARARPSGAAAVAQVVAGGVEAAAGVQTGGGAARLRALVALRLAAPPAVARRAHAPRRLGIVDAVPVQTGRELAEGVLAVHAFEALVAHAREVVARRGI